MSRNPGVRRVVAVAAVLTGMILSVAVAPASWFRATADQELGAVETAVIFGFGFEGGADAGMEPGAANSFLLDHVLSAYPNVDTLFVQEGVWVDRCSRDELTCSVDGRRLLRIDWHDERFDLNTLEIAACALERMALFEIDEAMVVAHDMQLARAVSNMERVRDGGVCPECELRVAEVPDTPYPERSLQLRTRRESVWRFIDLAARARDSAWLTPETPKTCPLPTPLTTRY